MTIKAARPKHSVTPPFGKREETASQACEMLCVCPRSENSYAPPLIAFSLLTTVKQVKTLNTHTHTHTQRTENKTEQKLCVWSHFPSLQSCSPILRKGFKISISFCHATVRTTYRLLHQEKKKGIKPFISCQKYLTETDVKVSRCENASSFSAKKFFIKFL